MKLQVSVKSSNTIIATLPENCLKLPAPNATDAFALENYLSIDTNL